MELYLMRHGTAERAGAGTPDAERALTLEGREDVIRVLDRARAGGMDPSLILSSPFRRAVETAALAASILGYQDWPGISEALLPDAEPEQVWDEVRARRDLEQLLLVGHEPLLGRAALFLLDAPTMQLDLRAGGLVRIDLDRWTHPRGMLKWLLAPQVAR